MKKVKDVSPLLLIVQKLSKIMQDISETFSGATVSNSHLQNHLSRAQLSIITIYLVFMASNILLNSKRSEKLMCETN